MQVQVLPCPQHQAKVTATMISECTLHVGHMMAAGKDRQIFNFRYSMKHPGKGILTLKSAKHVIADAWGKPKKSNRYDAPSVKRRFFSFMGLWFVFSVLFYYVGYNGN